MYVLRQYPTELNNFLCVFVIVCFLLLVLQLKYWTCVEETTGSTSCEINLLALCYTNLVLKKLGHCILCKMTSSSSLSQYTVSPTGDESLEKSLCAREEAENQNLMPYGSTVM